MQANDTDTVRPLPAAAEEAAIARATADPAAARRPTRTTAPADRSRHKEDDMTHTTQTSTPEAQEPWEPPLHPEQAITRQVVLLQAGEPLRAAPFRVSEPGTAVYARLHRAVQLGWQPAGVITLGRHPHNIGETVEGERSDPHDLCAYLSTGRRIDADDLRGLASALSGDRHCRCRAHWAK
jgi:hypothetical protein